MGNLSIEEVLSKLKLLGSRVEEVSIGNMRGYNVFNELVAGFYYDYRSWLSSKELGPDGMFLCLEDPENPGFVMGAQQKMVMEIIGVLESLKKFQYGRNLR